MNTKRYPLLLLLLLPFFAFAQTASEMDAMFAADTVSAARAARFVLGAAYLLPQELSGSVAERTAYEMASSNGWVKVSQDDALTLKDTAFLIMKAFDLKGGMMYSIFKNPRYAYREMVCRNLITGRMNGNIKVKGSTLLQILDKTISYADGGAQ